MRLLGLGKGQAGPPGPTGPTGATGPAGATGPQGPAGGSQTLAQTLGFGNTTGEHTIVMPMGLIDGTTAEANLILAGGTLAQFNAGYSASIEVDPPGSNGPNTGGNAYLSAGTAIAGSGANGGDLSFSTGIPDGAGARGQFLLDGAPLFTKATVRYAAGVPAGAPTGTELPIAFDSTAVTGGVYYWTGAAWVKGGTI